MTYPLLTLLTVPLAIPGRIALRIAATLPLANAPSNSESPHREPLGAASATQPTHAGPYTLPPSRFAHLFYLELSASG